MPAYDDPGNRLCLNGEPTTPSSFCPLPVTTTTERAHPLNLTIAGTNYTGSLRVDWQDRYTRIVDLIAGVFSLLFSVKKLINFKGEYVVRFPNYYEEEGREEFFGVNEFGPAATFTLLVQIDKKLDMLYRDTVENPQVASIIEHWQLRPEAERPQVALLWGLYVPGESTIASGKYQTTIPHCDPSILDEATNRWGYEKGAIQFLLTLKDNSKVIMYAASKTEAMRVYALIGPYIDPDMVEGAYIKWGEYSGPPFKPGHLRLRRADYYPRGLERQFPERQVHYPARANT